MNTGRSGIEQLRNNYFRAVDYWLIVPILTLTMIGIFVLNGVLSTGFTDYPQNLYKQAGAAVLGIFIYDEIYRGQGIGEKAINELAAKCAVAMKLKFIELNVRSSNSRAIKCYKKCGFIEKETIVKNNIKAIHMILSLYSTN